VTLETLFLFAPSGQGGGGLSIFLIQMMAIIAIFYFLIIRPKSQQEKKHKERLAQLKKGDKVVTVGGVIGEIVHIKDNQLTIRSGESRLVVQRERIADLVTGESQ
jgi:preprotein translocase subunit YajC